MIGDVYMCIMCGESHIVDVMIIDKDSTRTFCPNCLVTGIYNNYINFANNKNLTDDITGTKGAVAYIALNESYILNRETLRRLILNSLYPWEWKALNDKYIKPTGKFYFMLHEDFYDDTGKALQPVDKISTT